MEAFEVLDELIKITSSMELHKHMQVWLVQEIVEEERSTNFLHDQCDDLRRRITKLRMLISEMEALGARWVAVDCLECLRETQAREIDKLATLTEVLVETQASIHEKEGHVGCDELDIRMKLTGSLIDDYRIKGVLVPGI
ncbi:hypothetical protein Tco_1204981 [Tanacetum coccineum]